MSLFDGIRNLFDKDEKDKIRNQPVENNIPWFSPHYSFDYNENSDVYDQANYYWNTGEFPVIQSDKEEKVVKTGYEQDSSTPFDLNYYYSPTSPLYYTNFREEAAQDNKERLEEEARNKRGTLDRVFGLISNNSLVQGAYYALDDDDDTTFLQGVGEGFSFMNPFKDDVSNRKSFSDVIELIEKDKEPTDDKLGENVVEGLLGFAGDVLLDPLTYLSGGFSAIGKVAKGSGAAVKGLEYIDSAGKIISNVDDVANLSKVTKAVDGASDVASGFVKKTARDTYESSKRVEEASKKIAQNLSKNVENNTNYIKVLDADTARNIVKKYDTVNRYTDKEIDDIAENLAQSFNKTFFGLNEGGQDLTFFGQKIADANYFRKVGDSTIAPYYNKLANKIRQTKIASKFGANPYSKSAFEDFNDAFMPYFNEYMMKKNKVHIAKTAKEATDFADYIDNNFTKEQKDQMLDYMESGEFLAAYSIHKNYAELYEKAMKHAQKGSPEFQDLELKVKKERNIIECMDKYKSMIKSDVDHIPKKVLDYVDRLNSGNEFNIDEALDLRREDIKDIFGVTLEELDEKQLEQARELFKYELDPIFGVYGSHSVISSTDKSINQIIYDYVTDDSVFNISNSSDATKLQEKLFGDANLEDAQKAISKEMLRKLKVNSGKGSVSGVKELKNRYDAFDVFTRSLTNKHILRTYGNELSKVSDSLVQVRDIIDNMYKMLSKLEFGSDEYNHLLNRIRVAERAYTNPSRIISFVEKNVSDPILVEDLRNLLNGLNSITSSGNLDSASVNNLIKSLKAKFNSGIAKNKLNSKGADSIFKHNVMRGLSPEDRITIAKNIRETNQTKFYSYIDSLSNEEKYAKYFSPDSTATDTTKRLILRHECEKCFGVNSKGEYFLDSSLLSNASAEYLNECFDTAIKKIDSHIHDMAVRMSDIKINFDKNIDAIIDSYLKGVQRLSDEQLAAVKNLDPDSEMFKVMEEFQDRMTDVANKELELGILKQIQVDANSGKYVKHMLTKEAQDAVLQNPELYNRLGYYAEGVSTVKRSNQHRKFKTIREAERYLQKTYPDANVSQWFETDLAKLYCARMIDSDRLIGQKENLRYILNELANPYEGKGGLAGSKELFVNYEDLTQALMKKQGVHRQKLMETPKNIDFEVLREFGIDPDYVTSNNPLVRISEEGFEALNKYLDDIPSAKNLDSVSADDIEEKLMGLKVRYDTGEISREEYDFLRKSLYTPSREKKNTVRGYTLEGTAIDIINQNSLKQNNLTESAFWQLYDKFLSTYKMVNTIYSPAFYGNNILGNAFNSFLYCGAAAFDPRKLKIARGIASTGDPKQFLTLHGEKYSYKQLRDICGRLGISNTSFYEHEIRQDAKGFANMKLNKKLLEVSSGIEDTQRIALFVEALDNTGDFEKAVDVVNKFLFDYSDLSDFEHKVMKRAIPFYTFMRKNNPLQLEQIFCNPRIYRNLNYGFNNFEVLSGSNYVEDTNRNEWRKDYVQLPFQIGGENVGFNLNLPYETLERLTPEKILGQSSPLIKALPELYSGKYAFTGMDVNSVPEYLMNQVAPVRITDGISDKEGVSKALYGLSQATGINVATIKDQLGSQEELIDKYYPYINAENVGYEDEDIFAALLNKIKGDDNA